MNRTLFIISAALALALPASVSAASISLSPSTVSVTPGKTFTVTLTAVPSGAKVYTARANVSFDPALVSVSGFDLASDWLALKAGGYDLVDNANGALVKTAGYPGGVTAPTVFGTVTFTAKASGTATISVTGQSMMLDDSNKNALSGTQGSAVATIAAATAPAPAPALAKTTVATKSAPKPAVAKTTAAVSAATSTATTTESATTTPVAASTTSLAAAGTAAKPSSGSAVYVWLAALAVVLIGGLVWYRNRTA